MKKIIYSLLTLLALSFMSTAQEASPVTKLPGDANGYLILNKGFYSAVSSWRVVVKEKTWNAATSTYTYTTKLDQTLTGKHYLKIPTTYRNASHVMEITGLAGTTTIVHVNEMPIQDPVELLCTWICNGSNYAYSLELNHDPAQGALGSKVRMWFAPPPIDAPYYYQWVQDETGWYNSLGSAANYGFSTWGNALATPTDQIIHIDVPYGQYKYDQFGTPMNGAVVGVAKYYGPYTNNHHLINSDPLYLMGSECGNPISWALDAVNDGEDTPVEVVCVGTAANGSDGSYAEIMDPEAAVNDPCFEDYYDYIGWHAGSGTGVYQLVQIPCNWINTGSDQGTGTGIHWPEHVSRITMKSMYTSVGDPVNIVLKNENLFNDNGDFAGPNYNVPAGFYTIIYEYDDLSIASYFVEVTATTGSVVSEKEFLSYTTYPVPVVDDYFRIDFSASKKVEFTFELRDASNHLLFTDQYTVQKDEQVTIPIEPSSSIPDGLLFCKLTFSDNSVINYTIVK